MHSYAIPASVKDRVIRRQGKLMSHDTIDAARTALVVVDMQNYFVAEGFLLEVPLARGIVPNINRLARALRAAGGVVVWVQTTAAGALAYWANFHTHMLTPERSKTRLAHLDENAEGFALYPASRAVADRPARQENQIQRVHSGLVRHRRPIEEAAASKVCSSPAR